MSKEKMACDLEDWAFMLVLPTVLDNAPRFRHANVYNHNQ